MKDKSKEQEFIRKAIKAHKGRYDYSKVDYINSKTKVIITCLDHGDFIQTPNAHLMGQKCTKCNYKIRPDLSKIQTPLGSKAVPIGVTGIYAIVDNQDYTELIKILWRLTPDGYPYNRSIGYMHRYIKGANKGDIIDHINGNKLDNRRTNLRFCTTTQNTYNVGPKIGTSKYKGVSWDKSYSKWRAQINIKGKRKNLGRFDNEKDAAIAYNNYAKVVHGEFAYLNII